MGLTLTTETYLVSNQDSTHREVQLTKKQFHDEYRHLGYLPDCEICKRTHGSMRRITKVVDKHREQRRAHTWVMDGVTWSHRDNDGSKYMVVMRCKATSTLPKKPLAEPPSKPP